MSKTGRVITFYSFKGGTGRSMALANIATVIALRNGGKRVLALDWDLEAPGLHRYFRPYFRLTGTEDRDVQIDGKPGLIEFVASAREMIDQSSDPVFEKLQLDNFLLATDIPQLSVMKAGRFDSSYSERINTFDWVELFRTYPRFFTDFANFLTSQFDYVLIDSRTGYTDISGICTSLMPDTLVVVFTPNRQSLSGVLDVVRSAAEYRAGSDDLRPLRTFPIVSRVDLSELKLNDAWRFGDQSEDIEGYQPQFEKLFEQLYKLESCDLTSYFDEAQIGYVPYYAFGEKIAVRSEESGTARLSRSFTPICDMLLASAAAWDALAEDNETARFDWPEKLPVVPWDEEWFDDQAAIALGELRNRDKRYAAFMEVKTSLSRVTVSARLANLLDAVASAHMGGDARPIGRFVSANSFRPHPVSDGIRVVSSDDWFDFWTLRTNGDFFLLRSVPEAAPDVPGIYVERLIQEITEVILYFQRLYKRLRVTPRAEVRIRMRFTGLKEWPLRVPTEFGGSSYFSRTTQVYEKTTEVHAVLGRIDNELTQLVKSVAEPLLELFDFYSMPDAEYERIVRQFRIERKV